MKNLIIIDALPARSIIASNANAFITTEWPAPNIKSAIHSTKTIKILSISSKEPDSNNARNAISGWKEIKVAQQWPANAVNNFAINAEEQPVLMECVPIRAEELNLLQSFVRDFLEEEKKDDRIDLVILLFRIK